MSPLAITLVFRDVRLDAGGLGIDVRNLANGLAGRGHHVSVMTSAADVGDDAETGFDSRVEVDVLPSAFPGPVATAYGLNSGTGAALAARATDIVHVFSCVPAYLHFASMVRARRSARPVVWTPMVHPLRRSLWSGYRARDLAMRAFDAAVPRTARWVSAVAAATEAEAAEFRRLGCRRVVVIPPAVQSLPPTSKASAASVRNRFRLGDGPLVMAVSARAEQRKGFDFALAAIEAARVRVPDARFVIVGSGGADLPRSAGIEPIGRVSDDDLAALYRAAAVVFVPSSYEAFSRVVIEAWQQERPAVVTDRVGLAERVSKTGGAVVPYGDTSAAAAAIGSLVTNAHLSRQLGVAGRQLVEADYIVPRVVDQTERLYAEVQHG